MKTQGNRHFWQKQRRPGAELENPAFLPFRPFLRANCAVRNNLSRKTLRDLSKKFSPIFRCKNRGNHALNGAAKKIPPRRKGHKKWI
ncbi:hypothetical protein, partial [Caldibacillus debilis]|uniref:hypothetical protein n=1 Tax=Caldibacillus debilis TaxID=301148 RepID=UPI001F3BBDBF